MNFGTRYCKGDLEKIPLPPKKNKIILPLNNEQRVANKVHDDACFLVNL